MNPLNELFVLVVVIMIMSYGTGLIMGGPARANSIIRWEAKQLLKIGRWILKRTLRAIAALATWVERQI